MSEPQQLAKAIRALENGDGFPRFDYGDSDLIAAAVEPFLVAAERAGYERGRTERWVCPREGEEGATGILVSGSPLPIDIEQARVEGYERCKRDATTRIEAKRGEYAKKRADATEHDVIAFYAAKHDACDDMLAVVAALNATQQEAP